MAKGLAVSFVDVDGDGYDDILLGNDTVQNFLFHNTGDGRFEEVGAMAASLGGVDQIALSGGVGASK